jgi:hypothetical protein
MRKLEGPDASLDTLTPDGELAVDLIHAQVIDGSCKLGNYNNSGTQASLRARESRATVPRQRAKR